MPAKQRARADRGADDGDGQSRRRRQRRSDRTLIATGGAAVNRAHPAGDGRTCSVSTSIGSTSRTQRRSAPRCARYHADRLAAGEPVSWQTVVERIHGAAIRAIASRRIRQHVAMYAELRREYAILERLHKDRRRFAKFRVPEDRAAFQGHCSKNRYNSSSRTVEHGLWNS